MRVKKLGRPRSKAKLVRMDLHVRPDIAAKIWALAAERGHPVALVARDLLTAAVEAT